MLASLHDLGITDEMDAWYERRRLEQDVHLAAELGKMLLERNAELDTALEKVCTANQEQAYQIRHLTQRVAVLGCANEQAARAAEVAEATVREAELEVKRLRKAEQLGHHHEQWLSELVEELQSRLEEVEQATRARTIGRVGSSVGTTQVTMKGEMWYGPTLARSRRHSLPENLSNSVFPKEERTLESTTSPSPQTARAMSFLLAVERQHRAEAENGLLSTSAEAAAWEQRARELMLRVEMLEADVAETRQALAKQPMHQSSEVDGGNIENGETDCGQTADICTKGISILQEIDAKYQALLHRYEEHLAACQEERPSSSNRTSPESRSTPEYKQLFQEVFARLRGASAVVGVNGSMSQS
uniref:cerebellar degeneration-related protein 2-like isoform X2 n=1 Tax=Myxine glutinosa TaxID=7769 RepID=UPI00358F0C63